MKKEKLFHISEDPKIKIFEPLPAAFYTGVITRDVVFAISEKMLHNYLLPRNCPRVAFYAGPETIETDKKKFLGLSTAEYVIAVESKWLLPIQRTTLYCYEFPSASFSLLDECAGYYISNETIVPLSARPVYNVMEEMLKRNVELRFTPSIVELGESVKRSSLKFSLIRMQHAQTGLIKGNQIINLNGSGERINHRH